MPWGGAPPRSGAPRDDAPPWRRRATPNPPAFDPTVDIAAALAAERARRSRPLVSAPLRAIPVEVRGAPNRTTYVAGDADTFPHYHWRRDPVTGDWRQGGAVRSTAPPCPLCLAWRLDGERAL